MTRNGTLHSRRGLRIRGHRGPPEVRAALIRYARWLRTQVEFPMRVPAYLLPGAHVITMEGERVSASFFAPWDRTEEPYIRIATGDYPKLLRKWGRDGALAAYLHSLTQSRSGALPTMARDKRNLGARSNP